MGYEDRDYFQSKPKFEFSSGLMNGTKGLLIAVIAAYISALVISDSLNYADEAFWRAVGAANPKPLLGFQLFVLTPDAVVPFLDGYHAGYWKLLTHWIVPPSLFAALLDVVFIYFVGRLVEQLFGTKRFLILFLVGCIGSGFLASLVDWSLVGARYSVIMGPSGGIFACFITPVWIAPNQKSFFGWKLRNVVLGMIAFFGGLSVLLAVANTGSPAVLSPTQLIWGAGIGAVFMLYLKKRGRVPSVAGGYQQEENLQEWEKPGYLNKYEDKPFDERKFAATADKQRKAEEKELERKKGDQAKLDAILEKISEKGITSLSRSEKKFLDSQSKKK